MHAADDLGAAIGRETGDLTAREHPDPMAVMMPHAEFAFRQGGGIVLAHHGNRVEYLEVVGMHQFAETGQIHRRHMAFPIAQDLAPLSSDAQRVAGGVPFPGADGRAFHHLGQLLLDKVTLGQGAGQFGIGVVQGLNLLPSRGDVDGDGDAATIRSAHIDTPHPAPVRQGNLIREMRQLIHP